jgi:large exoprotein involved in heme utilization and adhesion
LFNQLNPGAIANNSQTPAASNPSGIPEFGLRVPDGKSLTLLGGNVSMDGGGLLALGGRVEVGRLSEPGTVVLNADGSLGFPTGMVRSNVSLTNGSRINAIADGGSITLNAGALEILDSTLVAGIGLNSGFVGVQGGDIMLNSSTIQIQGKDGGIGNNVRAGGTGNAGDTLITASDRAAFDRSSISSNVGNLSSNVVAVGDGGNIHITTPSLSLINGSQLQSITYGRGNGGDVIINAPDRVFLDGSSIFSTVGRSENTIGVGNAGDTRITTGSLFLTNAARLNSNTAGQGNAGDIRIITNSLSLSNDARFDASLSGRGSGGNVYINARDRVDIDNSVIFNIVVGNNVNGFGMGNSGDIRITTGSLFLTNGAQLQTLTRGQGNAGNVIINARDRVSLDGVNPTRPLVNSQISSTVGSDNAAAVAVGSGGDIRITTGSLSLTNGAGLDASTLGQGDAGNVIINVRDRVSLDGSNPALPGSSSGIYSTMGSENSAAVAVGNGGDIRITTGSLLLTNGGQLAATVFGQGDAGSVIVRARDRVLLTGVNATSPTVRSAILSDVNELGVGDGGDIRVTVGSLSLTNGARLNSSTSGQGNAGSITIKTRGSVSLEGVNRREVASAITTSTEADAQGRGGNISVRSDSVRLADRGSIFSSTRNRRSGGTVTITANTFEATGGSQVNTSSNNRGRAGNIILNAADRVTLFGVTNNRRASLQGNASGLYASTARGASAPSGSIQITTDQLQVFDRARIAVDSRGSGIGGSIGITAANVQLNDQARLTAETVVDDGGNITLRDVRILRLGNNSLISTTAGTDRAGGNGGNIDTDADFIVALDNSDITANAFSGSGGNVNITTEGLFGIAAQAQDNPLTYCLHENPSVNS